MCVSGLYCECILLDFHNTSRYIEIHSEYVYFNVTMEYMHNTSKYTGIRLFHNTHEIRLEYEHEMEYMYFAKYKRNTSKYIG